MATLLENANRIKTDKENIRQAIISKGIDVPTTLSLDNYDDKINEITAITDNTVFKPHPSFIELKDYYVRTYSDNKWITEKKIIKEERKYKCTYNGKGEYSNTTNGISFSKTISKEYMDNFFPKFLGYYVHPVEDDSYKCTLNIVDFEYVNKSTDGLDSNGKDENGVQFYNTISTISSSATYQTGNANTSSYYLIIKLTEDTGLLVYHTQNVNTLANGVQYIRRFTVSKDKSITLYSAATVATASTANTDEKDSYFACSLHAPNQIFVLNNSHNNNTGYTTYSFQQLICTTATNGTVTTSMSRVRNSDDTNVSLGKTSDYYFSERSFPNDLAVFARSAIGEGTIDLRTYLGDNQTNAVYLTGYSFDNNSHPVSVPVCNLSWRIYKTGTWHPELANELSGASTYLSRTLNAYIKGKDKDGYFIASYQILYGSEVLVQGKDYAVYFDSTNFKFEVIKEL